MKKLSEILRECQAAVREL